MVENVNYEDLLERCADKAYNFALRLAGNDADARDMVQEAFTRAFEHRDRYDPTRPFEAWIRRIIKNIYLDSLRRYDRRHNVSMDATPPTENGEGDWEDVLRGADPEPLDTLTRREEEALIQKALGLLPILYRTAVTLYDIEGFTYEEVAEIMECPIGTVCSRIYKGRHLVKEAFEKLSQQPFQWEGRLVTNE